MILIDTALQLKAWSFSDQPDILSLMKVIYPPVYKHLWEDEGRKYLERVYGESNFQKELADKDSTYLGVYVEGVPSGALRFILNKECPGFSGRSAMKLQRIFLHPDIHGQGVGKKLMDWVVAQAREYNQDLLWLECMDSQQQALRFYEKMGFSKGGAFDFPSNSMKNEFRGMLRMWKEVK